MDCSTPGFPVHCRFPEPTQTYVHQVSDAIQPSHPLSSPSIPTFNLSQHQGFFQGVSSSHHVVKVLDFSFSISPSNEHPGLIFFRMDWLESPCRPRDSQESSPTPQFKSISSSVLSFLCGPTLTSIHDHWKNHICPVQKTNKNIFAFVCLLSGQGYRPLQVEVCVQQI